MSKSSNNNIIKNIIVAITLSLALIASVLYFVWGWIKEHPYVLSFVIIVLIATVISYIIIRSKQRPTMNI